jgi:hypothetical protein
MSPAACLRVYARGVSKFCGWVGGWVLCGCMCGGHDGGSHESRFTVIVLPKNVLSLSLTHVLLNRLKHVINLNLRELVFVGAQ